MSIKQLYQHNIHAKDYVHVKQVPDWAIVHPLPQYDEKDPYLDNFTSGCTSILYSRQTNLCGQKDVSFHQRVYKVNNKETLNSLNSIEIDYNPYVFEEINIHYIRIIRNSAVFEVLDINKVHIIRQEKDLDRNIITGLFTCYYTIPGLRVGDIVEYAFSKEIINPSVELEGHYVDVLSDQIRFQTTYTLFDHYMILWPSKRPYFISNPNNFPLETIEQEDKIIFEIQFECPLVPSYDDNVSNSYVEQKQIFSISSEKDWKKIVQIKEEFYQIPDNLSQDLATHIQMLKDTTASPQKLIMEALEFCSNQIIYTSNSKYLSANIPDDPSIVYERRYGDCKDKSFLLITFLKLLGIEAYPALINTETRYAINAFAPNSYVFNHVIVCVFLENEKFWLDPTISYQGKSLEYGYQILPMQALILKNENSDITIHGCESYKTPEVSIEEEFDFRNPEKVIYSLTTCYRYNLAQEIRSFHENKGQAEFSQHSLSFIKKYYPSACVYNESSYEDNYEENKILINENYIIENIYQEYQDGNVYAKTFFTEIDRFLKPFDCPKNYVRKDPLMVSFPEFIQCTQNYVFEHKVDLPKDFCLKNSFFCFTKKVIKTSHGFKIDFSFNTLKSQVEKEFFNQYIQDVNEVIQETYKLLPYPCIDNRKKSRDEKLRHFCYWVLIFCAVHFIRKYIIKI